MVYILYGHFVLLDINKNRFLPSRLVLTTGIMGIEKVTSSPYWRMGGFVPNLCCHLKGNIWEINGGLCHFGVIAQGLDR